MLCLFALLWSSFGVWLKNHSFYPPINEANLFRDWRLMNDAFTTTGVVLAEGLNKKGAMISRNPMETDTFRIVANVHVESLDTPLAMDDPIQGSAGFLMSFIKEHDIGNVPGAADFYGLSSDITYPGTFFAIAGREDRFKPSVSFGFKEPGMLKTPLPRGIYWSFVDKPELEIMIAITGGTNVTGHVKRYNSEQWTKAFDHNLPEDQRVNKTDRVAISALNTNNNHRVLVKRFQISSSDDEQPGFELVDPHAEHLKVLLNQELLHQEESRKADELQQPIEEMNLDHLHSELRFLKTTILELSGMVANGQSILNKFYDEQMYVNGTLRDAVNNVAPPQHEDRSNEVIEHIHSLSNKFQQAERSFIQVEGRMNKEKAHLESSLSGFRSLFEDSTRGGKYTTPAMMVLLVILVIGVVFLISHMRKLEKKHIL